MKEKEKSEPTGLCGQNQKSKTQIHIKTFSDVGLMMRLVSSQIYLFIQFIFYLPSSSCLQFQQGSENTAFLSVSISLRQTSVISMDGNCESGRGIQRQPQGSPIAVNQTNHDREIKTKNIVQCSWLTLLSVCYFSFRNVCFLGLKLCECKRNQSQ